MPLTATGARGFLAGTWSHLSLHSAQVPTPDNELGGAGYARVPLAWEGRGEGVGVAVAPAFPLATASWQEVFSLAIRDSALADADFMAYVEFAEGISTDAGRRPDVARALLDFTVDDGDGRLTGEGRQKVYGYGLARCSPRERG